MADEHDPGAAPDLPTIVDEAVETPMWLPIVGIAIFLLGGMWLVMQALTDDAQADSTESVIVEN